MERVAQAAEILDDFATRTGLTAAGEPRRYLWTDAFAVMTWIGLHEETGQAKYLELAARLIAQVHEGKIVLITYWRTRVRTLSWLILPIVFTICSFFRFSISNSILLKMR